MKSKAKTSQANSENEKLEDVLERKKTAHNKDIDFPVVAIGASAGGLEALELFFGNMPENNEMAFVVIQHLDPNHKGIMPELLQRITTMKVSQASDNLKIEPNCVYVIPPRKNMSILKGILHLFDQPTDRGIKLPIDVFFRSLAADRHEKSIGIILSGMGSDGSMGIKAIKEKNGLVLIQDPASAKFNSMPLSAASAVIPDIVAPAEELPSKLISYFKFLPKVTSEVAIDTRNKSNLDKIIILLREHSGHDFSHYKRNTLFRRIERRKGVHQLDKIQNYVRLLQESPAEVDILFKELLIGVTSFFRDPALWESLKEKILPALINELPEGYVLRAWITACSTGEEAYSLAIIFKEVIEKIEKPRNITLQIFATDLDIEAVEKARRGEFAKNIAADVSSERLKRFFNVAGSNYIINPTIREMVVFAPQNVIKDPPFTKLNILFCRNMLIYMETKLQKKLISLFNYSLVNDGIMVLGSSESLGINNDGFTVLNDKLKIFKRTSTIAHTEQIDFPSSFKNSKPDAEQKATIQKNIDTIQTRAEQIILQYFAPPSVLTNFKGDIIYITGHTGKYLEPAAGKANWNIHAMARDEIRQSLSSAFHKVKQTSKPLKLRNIRITPNGTPSFVDITIQAIDNTNEIRGVLLIVFQEVSNVSTKVVVDERNIPGLNKTEKSLLAYQKELEIELKRNQEELQSTREEMQTSQEELKSANEELQSTNEELQSTNEELTTSKEEMQSLNEELQTVNIELQSKVSDFARANDDMKNLLNSTEIATLFLDKELNIRRYTDQVTNIFKLRPTDIGRPFTELVTDLKYPKIENDAKQVIKTLSFIESAIATKDNRWFSIRIMPYRTLNDHIDGLVITFTNITKAKQLELDLKKANEALRKS